MSKFEEASSEKGQIALRAYALYLQRGGEEGHDIEDWLTAEEELRQEQAESSAELETQGSSALVTDESEIGGSDKREQKAYKTAHG
jgi:hypothetical protein